MQPEQNDDQKQQAQQQDNPTPGKDPVVFTQEQVDSIIKERLARAQEKYAGHDDFKSKAEQWDKLQESQKSETQKLSDQLAAKDSTIAELRKQLSELQVRQSFHVLAGQGESPIPADRLESAYKLLDRSGVTFKDDGSIEGLQAAFDKLRRENAFLFAQTPPTDEKRKAKDIDAAAGANKPANASTEASDEKRADIRRRFGMR